MQRSTKNGWADNPISQQQKRDYQREWKKKKTREKRDEYIQKRGGCCEHCGCSVSLNFHHRMPQFKTTHRIFHLSRKRIEVELAHCDLLCHNPCHRKAQDGLKKPRQWCGL
jgi:hypothetical protein